MSLIASRVLEPLRNWNGECGPRFLAGLHRSQRPPRSLPGAAWEGREVRLGLAWGVEELSPCWASQSARRPGFSEPCLPEGPELRNSSGGGRRPSDGRFVCGSIYWRLWEGCPKGILLERARASKVLAARDESLGYSLTVCWLQEMAVHLPRPPLTKRLGWH